MSLQVWLPLNGSLENLGLNDLQVTNNNATVNDNGKIGKCYYFNGSSQYLQFNKSLSNLYCGDFSWAVWLNPTDDTRGIIISEYSSTGASNVALELLANRVVRVYWNASPDWSSGIAIDKDIWSHVIVTRHGNELKLYINGELKATKSNATLADRPSSSYIRIGDDYRGGTSVSYMGYMNDVRIYDHCLSIKEVKEIYKSLVLHYKLDDPFVEPTTNLVTGITAGGQTTVQNNVVTTSGVNSDTYFSLNLSESIVSGVTYTVSCDADIPGGLRWGFPLGAQSNSNYYFWIYDGHNEYTFTANDIDWGNNRLFLDDNASSEIRTSGYKTKMYNFQLEKKDHATGFAGYGATRSESLVYDSSGYNNHGTVVGTLSIKPNSARYNISTMFDGSTSCIRVPYNAICPHNIFTCNLWFKKDSLGSKNYETLFGGPSGFEMDTRAGGASTLSLYMASTRGGNIYSPLSFSTWYMVTMVRDGTNEMYYINGELVKTITAKSMPTGNYFIGAWSSVTSQNYYGVISDFRIYVVPLTAYDILELYKTTASSDRNSNFYIGEVVEV